jgi:hypothetical protein
VLAGLHGAHERAHELPLNLFGSLVRVDSLGQKKLARLADVVDAGGLFSRTMSFSLSLTNFSSSARCRTASRRRLH